MISKLAILSACLLSFPLAAAINGKVETGPTYVHLDILESGKTVETKELFAIKSDATLLVYEGLCLKPSLLFSINSTELVSGGLGIGYYLPICSNISITPSFGCSFTYLRTTYHLKHPLLPEPIPYKERFHSASPYLCLDASWTFYPKWRVSAAFQYAWSKTWTTIKHLAHDTSHTQGPSYSIALERDLSDCLSISIGAAYNIGLSKERHGLRGAGTRLALAYWF